MDLSPDDENFQGRLLHQAALWDNVELLQELIASGADVDARDSRRRTALHAAALADRSRCLAALCAAGADVDARAEDAAGGKTALHIAAERGHVENVAALLKAGAALDVLDAAGDAPLALADRHRRRHAAHALREHRDALERERLSQHAALRELVSRGEAAPLRARLAGLRDAGLVVNLTPAGASTLLYVASEAGQTSAVAALLEAGADGRAHPVTRYGPLYAACRQGHLEAARLLLHHFPQAVQQETVEKWLPLHAACMGGHAALVTLLLEHAYPEDMLSTYTDESEQWQYQFALDVNARDAGGHTALYLACARAHLPAVDALLNHTVRAHPVPGAQGVEPAAAVAAAAAASKMLSPQRGGISLGIHAIVSKLTGQARQEESGSRVRAVHVDALSCGDSCVARAVRGNHARLLRRLLHAGARPDAPAAPPGTPGGTGGQSRPGGSEGAREVRRRSRSASAASARANSADDGSEQWTALALAARLGLAPLVEMLLEAGAADERAHAAREASARGLHALVPRLLATKAQPDPDYKLDKSLIAENVLRTRDADAALSYSARCPSTPAMLTWRELRCQLTQLRMWWVRLGCARVNPGVALGGAALLALTRLDVAGNELRALPPDLFTLLSLRYLNAAQNKLEKLPQPGDPLEEEPAKGRNRRSRPEVYSAPALQELYLQDNRLEEIPGALFRLPALQSLDVSNNKLRALPPALWAAPALRDLSAALNHLRDLPAHEAECGSPKASSPGGAAAPDAISDHSAVVAHSASLSRSPSIEGESECADSDDAPVAIAHREHHTVCTEAVRAHEWRGELEPEAGTLPGGTLSGGTLPGSTGSRLQALNLAHNQFTCVPAVLACRAPALTRLNMAYNSLRSMSYVTSYPTSLRQLDLSHNEITCWPSLPQVETFSSSEGDPLACYCPNSPAARARPRSGGSVRAQLLSAACPARRHLRLEGLRTLILSNNLLTRIQLTTDDDDGLLDEPRRDANDDAWSAGCALKSRLVFPQLSMLDVSCNLLRAVPPALHALANLAVLNLSGNRDITDLPPQMGLLSRLWNLSASGCSLQEPLRSMLRAGRCRSADVVGYLKSVLQEARPYPKLKLMLVGQQGIGKTSLLECLRQESAIQHRRKPTDHWAKRMGNKSSRRNLSTVGVDIGAWVYEKQRAARGPVTFRTWDFGGQQEYYATHQYFVSRRSLFLVVWRATDGRQGLATAISWLRSIQARAPGSPVIMVATHYDQVANCSVAEWESPEALQRLIRCSVMGAPDADKRGLPRVLDSIEVSCSSRHNIRLLADIIYSVAFSVKQPGSKEPLLQQPVPAAYIALEECVAQLALEPAPVLHHDQYQRLVTQYMQQRSLRPFRDAAELQQATMFLHENGVLLHYEDASLKELYFVRPQWLCDVLAHVVSVREVNPFRKDGIMRTEELAHVFKASPLLGGEEAAGLALSLLNKFELALSWDARLLLVPPLLPDDPPLAPQLLIRSRGGRAWPGAAPAQLAPAPGPAPALPPRSDSPAIHSEAGSVSVSGRASCLPLRRLLLLSYVPRGFWPRLTTRVLADAALAGLAARLYTKPHELEVDEAIAKALDFNWGWSLWKTGMRLSSGELTLLLLRELPPARDELLPAPASDHGGLRFLVRSEGAWVSVEAGATPGLELLLPAATAHVRRLSAAGVPANACGSISLEPNPEVLAKVLALVSDHVDLLLEDWYPSLGTRFVHTSEGRCLITRLVPCPLCLRDLELTPDADDAGDHAVDHADHGDHADHADHGDHALSPDHAARALGLALAGAGAEGEARRLSEESRASDRDSGVGAESNASSRGGSVEGRLPPGPGGGLGPPPRAACAWPLEECILSACTGAPLVCATHGRLPHRELAPDTLLLDVEEPKRARWAEVSRFAVAGRGAFGTVLAGAWRRVPVALKALQPVPPPPASDVAVHHAYKAALSRWEREPVSAACRAYCGLRQELSVLSQLRHPHVLPLLGVCARPLALLLAMAPRGALDGVLRSYRNEGARVGERAARALALQLAKALEYLHAARVLYRDLKSENVLVWEMPVARAAAAAELSAAPLPLHVKLGDYGISRMAPPSGTKGFGGTEGFMAPEIMRYNGEEEYNEKVDCFSYGMVLYEVVSLRQPFEGHEAVKEAILEGARPALTNRELSYPCNILETMRRCWSGRPERRPSAAALVSAAAAPEFAALRDVAAAREASAAAAVPLRANEEGWGGGWEVWAGGEAGRARSLVVERGRFTHQHVLRLQHDKTAEGEPVSVTAMCRVGGKLWLGDSAGRVSVYSASSLALLWSVAVHEAVGGAPSAPAALLPLPRLQRVALALHCGRLFLVTSQRPGAEGGFVLSELGAATSLACLAGVPTPLGCEVWAGGSGLHAYEVWAGGVRSAHALETPPGLTLLAAHQRQPYVFGYCYPGVCVYQWSAVTRQQTARLDCSKLAPCSETLHSMGELVGDEQCRVLSLCVAGARVFAGTSRGALVVADAGSLRPLTVCRPYERDITCIVPLLGEGDGAPMLATFGDTYRPLLERFAPTNHQQQNTPSYAGGYCLLWSAHHWLPD